MVISDLLPLAELGQSVTILLSLVGYIPQWHTLYTTKSSKNISLNSWYLWLVSALLTLNYATVAFLSNGSGFVLVATSSLGLVLIGVTIFMICFYREPYVEVSPALETETLSEATTSIEQIEALSASQVHTFPDENSIAL